MSPWRRLWHTSDVQRHAALALLAIFAYLMGAPFAVAFEGADASLPACCRSTGAHHCARAHAPGHSTGASLTGAACRAFPQHPPALLQPQATQAAPSSLDLLFQSSPFHTVAALERYAQARRTRSPRGPPFGTRLS